MNKQSTLLGLALCLATSMAAQPSMSVTVTNHGKQQRADYPVVIDISKYSGVRSALVTCKGVEVPCQIDDLDQDGSYDELCFLVTLDGGVSSDYRIELKNEGEPRPYPARVYAEMVMRNDKVKEKNRHDNYVESITARGDCANSYNLLHHHGVDFESELNGIRIYFDKRQTLDLYGKFKKRLELKDTQFYTSQEQKDQGYGDDVLWVGNTFGLGAMRGWDGQQPTMVDPVKNRTQRIVSYGPLRTIVEVIDRGWVADASLPPIDMTLRYTQYGGHRDTDVDVTFGSDVARHRFSTGIINVKESEEYTDHHGLRACWGTDYPSTDHEKWKPETVGLAILIPAEYIDTECPTNSDNYAFVVKAGKGNSLHYKVAYCSANEEFGFHSQKEWFDWVRQWRDEHVKPGMEVTLQTK